MFQIQEGHPRKLAAGRGLSHAEQWDKGHGRIERRTLVAQGVRATQVDWPGARQVFLLRRQRRVGQAEPTVEFHCGITSLPPSQVDAAELLAYVRGHWGIENRLFRVRDVTLGEDACRVRSGAAAQNWAALRNVVLVLLTQAGCTNKAAALRRHAAHFGEALELVQASGP